tara:strand:- start:121 stop:489 length:369 start_codon:yes stop_codon:yes gene_type:complete
MKYLNIITVYLGLIVNIGFTQSSTITVVGSHTLTQSDGMGLYEALDLCLRTAIRNGLFDYVKSEIELNDEQRSNIMGILDDSIEMIVMNPSIVEQSVTNNTITMKAKGEIDPMILNSILNIE